MEENEKDTGGPHASEPNSGETNIGESNTGEPDVTEAEEPQAITNPGEVATTDTVAPDTMVDCDIMGSTFSKLPTRGIHANSPMHLYWPCKKLLYPPDIPKGTGPSPAYSKH